VPQSPIERPTATAPLLVAPGAGLFELLVIDGASKGRTLALHPGVYVLGKGADCALVIEDTFVSRKHVELRVARGLVALKDLGSKNGTYVAGAQVTEAMLRDGAMLRIGRTTLRLSEVTPGDDAAKRRPKRFGRLVGQSPGMQRLFEVLEQVAKTDVSVLLEGETGTGKELCAEAIHQNSARAHGAFVICDLGGIHRSLLESELFGHVRGAF